MFRIPFKLDDDLTLRLSASRARQHQKLLNVRIAPHSPPGALTRLVDVELLDADVGEYRHSGMSLAELLSSLEQRRPFTHARLVNALQEHRRSFELLARELSTTVLAERTLQLPQPPYASALVAHLRGAGPNTAPVAQWRGLLASAPGRGVRQHEIESSGLKPRLARLPGDLRLTRREVVDRVGLSHVVPRLLCEVRVGFHSTAGWAECCRRIPARRWRALGLVGRPPHALHLERWRHRALGWSVVRSRYRDLFTAERDTWCVLDDRGRRVDASQPQFPSARDARAWAEAELARRCASWPLKRRLQRWQQFALVGGEGYEELLLQLDALTSDYASPHFPDVRNVVVHVRTSRHPAPGGGSVLFVDELQSDWVAAAGRGEPGVPPPPFRAEWVLLALKTLVWWARSTGSRAVAFSTAELQQWRWDRPPVSVYEKHLPAAARDVAAVLQLRLDRMDIRVPCLLVQPSPRGWLVRTREGEPTTKPFDSRAAAERFAAACSSAAAVEVPVLWLDDLPPIRGVPLYGAGTASLWLGEATAQRRSERVPREERERAT